MAIKIPTDIIGQEIIPGDLVVHIHSKGRGSKSSIEVVYEITAKSVSFGEGYGYERSIKCLKVTEEQALNHRVDNYSVEEQKQRIIQRKIQESRELK
jgi:hypothetical protein